MNAFHTRQYARLQIGNLVNHPHVQLFIVTLIAVNAVMMGIATFDVVKDHPDTQEAFEITDRVFLVIFTVELCMQFFFHGWRLLQDGWLIFDLIIIVTSWAFAELQIVRAFRIFRALRLITRIAVMQNLILGECLLKSRSVVCSLRLFDEEKVQGRGYQQLTFGFLFSSLSVFFFSLLLQLSSA